ncbi:serine/threonine-protein phosphatase PGAM5, mitochondrial isoform X1 [Folsomia candida]|nr:serine/threonine-protein phosphatase PGAM5, mitochondrial isoform X1 [Folsomia candida]XP_021953899.1 serine/threonine-protein phosphatase PGAM5, mitochondrial isoform X1 [Folsomia candida]
MHRTFWKYGRWIGYAAGAVTATSMTVVVSQCSTSNWSPTNPSAVPDAGFPKWDFNWDKREPYSLVKPPKKTKRDVDPAEEENKVAEQLEKKKSKVIRHIILIRHGQYNLKGSCDDERSLSQLGIEQAELTGNRLKNSGVTFTSLLTSNMCRAIQTSEIVLKHLGQKGLEILAKDPMLREGAPCLPEPPVSSWHPDLHQYFEDGARIEAAFRKYFHRAHPDQKEDSYELIVCHANVIRYFVCRAMQFPPEAWLRISLNHTSLTMLSILPSGRVILRSLGDSGHLPADKMTTS